MKKLLSTLLALCLLLPCACAEDALTAQAKLDLTEVLGYTAEEADRFVFEPQPDGTLRYWHPDHPGWVYRSYTTPLGFIRADTPFDTGYGRFCGENAVHEALRAARREGWFRHWDEAAREALLEECARDNIRHIATDLLLTDSAARAVQALLETCYGPACGWTQALWELRDEVLAENGLTLEETPFHQPGLRRNTAPDPSFAAVRTLTLFEGETPEELRTALDVPQLAGWRVTSGAVSYMDWGDRRAPSGAGFAAFERKGRRQLIQLYWTDQEWKAWPLGENALYQSGDYRVTYDGLHGSFAVQYLLEDHQIAVFYLNPMLYSDSFEKAFCWIGAYERYDRATGEGVWINVTQLNQPTWQKMAVPETATWPAGGFPTCLGVMPISQFPTSPETAAQPMGWLPAGCTVVSGVNLRAKTSSHSASLGMLLPGVILPVLETLPGDPYPWIHTKLGFLEGYIAANYAAPGDSYSSQTPPLPVAETLRETSLKDGTGFFSGTVEKLPAGARLHVIMEEGGWLYVSVPREEITWQMDTEGTFGYVKASDLRVASLLCQLDWMR